MKKLPIGIQTFQDIRRDEFIYVDKTSLIYELVLYYRYIFLSRPRRFGKSMLIDTIKCLFEGRKELFLGLYIENRWNWEQSFPVVKIDFTSGDYKKLNLTEKIGEILRDVIQYHDLSIVWHADESILFKRVLQQVHQKYKTKVVILVDEYDKPILDCLTQTELAQNNRDILRGFYSVIKGCDAWIQFAMLTGVSKFSKTSIFSGLNNLFDITLFQRCATICGYTEEELDIYFADYLESVNRNELKKWYNGYCWDSNSPKVYNPYDILLYLNTKKF
ncbi:MAG: AAA family ATPase, partial [Bacteroidia bacterium]|nr:AAA family ATPase [Bacteroidia bacterium]